MSLINVDPSPAASSRRIKAVIVVSVFLNFMGFTVIAPVIPFLISQYSTPGQTALFVGLMMSIYGLCAFIAAPVLGAVSDRYGRRPVLLISLAGSALGYVVFGIGGAMWVLFAGRIIEGLTAGNISTLYALVADVTPPQDRGRFYGILGATGGLGFMLGPALGGLLGERSLAMPLFVAAGLSLLNLLWIYLAVPESRPQGRSSSASLGDMLNPFGTLMDALGFRALRIAFAAVFLFCLAGTMLQSNLSVFLKDQLSFGPGRIGAYLFVVGVMDILSQGFISGRLLSRYSAPLIARWGLSVNVIGALLVASVAFIPSSPLLFIAIAVFVLGDGLFQPAISGVIANATPDDLHGRVQGANQAQQSIARFVGPVAGALLYGLHPSGPYFCAAVVLLLALALLGVVRAASMSRPVPAA